MLQVILILGLFAMVLIIGFIFLFMEPINTPPTDKEQKDFEHELNRKYLGKNNKGKR